MKLINPSILRKAVSGRHVLVDTNIIIYLTDSITPYNTLSAMLFEMIERGETSAVFSIVSIAEVMQGPLKKGLSQNALDVKRYLMNFPNTFCQEITGEILGFIGADSRIDWLGLRTIDALIIASGLLNKVDLIISNDLHFKKALTKKIILSFDE